MGTYGYKVGTLSTYRTHRMVTDWSQAGHRMVTDWSQTGHSREKRLQKRLQSGHIRIASRKPT